MSIKVKLEKEGKVVNGFTGFSWTLLLFGFWVPAFRERGKDFGLFFLFFIIKVLVIISAVRQNLEIANSFFQYGVSSVSYSMLIPSLLLSAIQCIEIWLASFYNKYYTTSLLAEGYYPLENDEYSIAILKDYTYLPYTKEELEDNSTMTKYKEISTFARKEESSKIHSVLGIFAILNAIGFIINFLGAN